ncbi:MAG: c-type heme family protein [Burkholderiales bacterium]
MRAIHRAAFLGVLLLAASLEAQSALPRGTWRIADAPSEVRHPISRGDLIVVSMQQALLRELTDGLDEGGPAFAIKSCHIDVVGVTQRIARYEGVAAGRTSDRLRNPTNAPRPWAAPLVKAYAGHRVREVDGFAVDLGDKVGLLRPIAHRPICASCHGPADKLSPIIREALKDRYPVDQAVGFNEGEIRGWFWVEVPKKLR